MPRSSGRGRERLRRELALALVVKLLALAAIKHFLLPTAPSAAHLQHALETRLGPSAPVPAAQRSDQDVPGGSSDKDFR